MLSGFGCENLRLEDVPVPDPRPGEVKVAAVSLNYRDKLVIAGGMGRALDFPFTPGSDLAGTIIALDDGVSRFRVGDAVISTFFPDWIDGAPTGDARSPGGNALGGGHPGVLAEYTAVPVSWFVLGPGTLDLAAASTLPSAGLTAWFALIERGGLSAGSRVLVQGTGGVALFGLQLAKAHGAEVLVTSCDPEKREGARALGADHMLDRAGWGEAVHHLTGHHGIDYILEITGGPHLARSLEAVAVQGRISVIGVIEGYDLAGSAGLLLLKMATIQGIRVRLRRALEDLVRAVDVLRLKPVIDQRYRFTALPEALDHLDRGAFGKIVVTLD